MRERLDRTFFGNELRPRLGELLLEKGLLTEEQLDEALGERSQNGGLLGETLVRLGFIFEDELARVLAEQSGARFFDLDANSVDPQAAAMLPLHVGEALCALPVRFLSDGGLVVAVADPIDPQLPQQLKLALGREVDLAVTTASSIRRTWRTLTAG
jgi:type IV pilus assembly protein PilB